MKLNHLNLTVTDVPATSEFLEEYFGLRSAVTRGDSFAALADDDNLVLSLMKGKEVSYPGIFHVGFVQESEELVDEINRRLKDDGYDVKPPERFHGSWTFYCEAPGGFTVEVLSGGGPA